MIGVAAHEDKEVAAPIRDPEAENVAIEAHNFLDVEDPVGHVPQLEDVEDARNAIRLGELILGIEIDRRALGILERYRLGNAGRDARAALALDPVLLKLSDDLGEVAAWRDLERE